MRCACCPFITVSAVLVGGILTGMGLQSWLAGRVSARAQDKSANPSAEKRLRDLKIALPPVSRPTNTYVTALRVGDLLYVSGTGPGQVNGKTLTGRLGQNLDMPQGRAAARLVGLQVLSVIKEELGSLDRVERLVKTFGMVNATPDFTQHSQVINGFSDLLVEIFGAKAGKATRSSVGMASLPGGIPVEIEAIFQVRK